MQRDNLKRFSAQCSRDETTDDVLSSLLGHTGDLSRHVFPLVVGASRKLAIVRAEIENFTSDRACAAALRGKIRRMSRCESLAYIRMRFEGIAIMKRMGN